MNNAGDIHISSLTETKALGQRLGALAQPGDVITLTGDLGAGKTTLTQSIGRGLSVPEFCYITSPTFSLLHEYRGRIPLYHFDMYRLSEEEITDLGFEDYFYGDGLCVIEWPERLGSFMPQDRIDIELCFVSDTGRRASIRGYGKTKQRIADLLQAL